MEVKSSSENYGFVMTPNEWQLAREKRDSYLLVYVPFVRKGAKVASENVTYYRDIYGLATEGRLKHCINVRKCPTRAIVK